MPVLSCKTCGYVHPNTTPCTLNDPKRKPVKVRQLRRLRGLPDDCPGCLGYGTIQRKTIGRAVAGRHYRFDLKCTACGRVYQEEQAR